MTPEPYPDATAHLHDEFRLLDARLQRRLVGAAGAAATGNPDAPTDGDVRTDVDGSTDVDRPGGAIISSDADYTAADTDSTTADADYTAADTDSTTADADHAETEAALRDRIDRSVAATETTGATLPLVTLAARFDLGSTERDALVAGVAPVVDPDYGSLFGYLQDDRTRRRPTVGLLVDLLAETARERLAVRELFARDAPLRATGLVGLAGDAATPRVDRAVVVDDRIADYLLGVDSLPASLADCCSATTPTGRLAALSLPTGVVDRLRAVTERASDEASLVFAHLHGPKGVGTEAAVVAGCAEAGVARLLDCDAVGLLGDAVDADRPRVVGERLRLLVREARLRDCPLHLRNVDGLVAATGSQTADGAAGDANDPSAALLGSVVAALDRAAGAVFTTGTADLPAAVRTRPRRHRLVTVDVPGPDYERRRECWAAVEDLPADVAPARLAATFRLTPGGIEEAVALARTHSAAETDVSGDATLTREAIYAGCRAVTGAALGRHARKVDPTFGWDDIVLSADPARRLRDLADRIAEEGRVYDDWGFGARYARGGGVAALFTGPSGTGKTMAAEVLARESGRDLYKIDLASVVSKYVGETETRLGEIFDGAAGSNAILLFDEADALFGKRSQVSDAHDRYANVETNYLLQRIEDHDGVVLLTSNFPENIDDAFRRRLHLTVPFPRPDADARETIWRRVFPAETPVGELDYEFLASFELTGGDVKNAALTAAFLAVSEADGESSADRNGAHASDEARVEMRHVVPAVRDELRKTGSLVDPTAFAEYGGFL